MIVKYSEKCVFASVGTTIGILNGILKIIKTI